MLSINHHNLVQNYGLEIIMQQPIIIY